MSQLLTTYNTLALTFARAIAVYRAVARDGIKCTYTMPTTNLLRSWSTYWGNKIWIQEGANAAGG